MLLDPSEFDLHDDEILDHETEAAPVTDAPLVVVPDARARVLARYPSAQFVREAGFGRIVADDRLVSLAFSVTDPDVEAHAWSDAAGRCGSGTGWRPSGPIDRVGRFCFE